MTTKNNRCIVMGWDGATWDLLKPWAEDGTLPNLAKLLDGGAHGVMNSTIPPLTPTAWTSIYTGMNPGKHGVFGFTLRPRETVATNGAGDVALVSSKNISAPRIWHILNAHGLKTGLINLPITYPPEPVDGFMITGMMTPGGLTKHGNSFPDNLVSEVEKQIGMEYIVDVAIEGAADDFLGRLEQAMTIRERTIEHLIDNKPWDLFFAVSVIPDRIQHIFWKYIMPGSSLYDSAEAVRLRPRIIKLYQRLDDLLGRLMDRMDEQTFLVLISDHGFTSLRKAIYVNNWLEKHGYLSVKTSQAPLRKFMKAINIKALKKLVPLAWVQSAKKQTKNTIDWDNTKAFASTPDVHGIFINVRGREPNGIVEPGAEYHELCDKLIEQLTNLKDPIDNEPLVERVYRNSELFSGEYSENGPDLVIVTKNENFAISDNLFEKQMVKSLEDTANGDHEKPGVIAFYGANIRKGITLKTSDVMDVTPSILHGMGIPSLDEMDGSALQDVFDASLPATDAKKISTDELISAMNCVNKPVAGEIYTEEESDAIKKHLKALGYLD